LNKPFYGKKNHKGGVSLDVIRFQESKETDGSSIEDLVRVLWLVASHLLKPFTDILAICSRGIKSKLRRIMDFYNLPQVCLAKAHVTKLPRIF